MAIRLPQWPSFNLTLTLVRFHLTRVRETLTTVLEKGLRN